MLDPIERTQSLIRLMAVNPPGNEAARAWQLVDLLRAGGFEVECHALGEGRLSLVARKGRGSGAYGLPMCLTGHLDTVPVGKVEWLMDPLGGEIIDGKLYGRGASHMKSGVAAMVVAALSVSEELEDAPGLILVLTAGETGRDGALHLARMGEGLGKAGAIVVGEPTDNQPRLGHRGVALGYLYRSERPWPLRD